MGDTQGCPQNDYERLSAIGVLIGEMEDERARKALEAVWKDQALRVFGEFLEKERQALP